MVFSSSSRCLIESENLEKTINSFMSVAPASLASAQLHCNSACSHARHQRSHLAVEGLAAWLLEDHA